MALVKCTEDNVFVGAIVLKGDEKLYVYKVNAKSLYIGKEKEKNISARWENRTKGMKWVDFMKHYAGEKSTYDSLLISSEEVNKKAGFIKIKEARESMKDWLGASGKKIVKQIYIDYKKGKKVSYFQREFGRHKLFLMGINKDGHILFRLDQAYLFFDVYTEVYTRFDKKIHKSEGKILYPERVVTTTKIAV